MPRPPRWMLALCLVLGAGIALSAGLGIFRTVSAHPTNWFVFGFETLLLVAGVFGIGCGLGKYREGPALAMLCVGGTVIVASVLGYTALHKTYLGIQRDPLTFARLSAGGGFAALAALTVMARRPHASSANVVTGLMLSALAAGVGAILGLPGPRGAVTKLHPVLASLAFLVLGALLITFVSAAAHHFIRALEHGKDPPVRPDSGEPSGA